MRPLAIAVDIISGVVVLSATLCYDWLRGDTSALPNCKVRSMRPLAIGIDIISGVVVLSATLCYDEVTTKRANGRPPLVSTSKPSGWPVYSKKKIAMAKKLKSEQNRVFHFSSEA